MKRLLGIWLRNWPIQRLQNASLLSDPPHDSTHDLGQLNGRDASTEPNRPIILWQSDPRRGRQVIACCDRARSLGVRNGIAIAQATELVTCNAARLAQPRSQPVMPVIMEHDRVADHIAIETLASELQTEISPLVAIESLGRRLWAGQAMLQPDTLFCDLSGVTHLFENEVGILNATHRCLRRFGVVGRLAIADCSAAAWAHAHYNSTDDFISTQSGSDLALISVDGLRIETEIKYALDRLGIQTIGALLRLPRAGLARRLGEPVVKRIAEVLGEIEVPLQMHHAEQQHRATHALEYPTDDLEIVADRIERLTAELISSLASKQRGALRVSCRLDLLGNEHRDHAIGLFAPTLDHKHLVGLINASIESLKLPAEIIKITLVVLQSGRLRTSQVSLFATQSGAGPAGIEDQTTDSRALARLVDGLTSRMGRDAVLGIRASENPLPEKAYRTYSLTDHRTRKAIRKLPAKSRPTPKRDAVGGPVSRPSQRHRFRSPTRHDARRRPMKLLRTPVRLTPVGSTAVGSAAVGSTATAQVHGSVPTSGNIPVPAFRAEGQVHRIVYFWGPERIETGWWSGPSVRRDYYRVETDTGRLWWVYRDLHVSDRSSVSGRSVDLGEWFLHGRFS